MKLLSKTAITLSFLGVVAFANQAMSEETIEVGVAWYGKSSMARTVLAGAQERLHEIAPHINLEVRGELADVSELDAVVSDFEQQGKDGLIVLRSGGVKYLGENPPELPTFIGGNNHPVVLGGVDSMTSPSGTVTGVTYYVELRYPIERFMAMAPDTESFLLVSEVGHPSSGIDGPETMEICAEMKLTCEQVFTTGEADIFEVVSAAVEGFDAIILGNNAKVFDNSARAIEAAGNRPVFSYAAGGVDGGALAGLVISDSYLGALMAESLVEVLVEGRQISDVGIKTDQRPTLRVNLEAAVRYGIDFRNFE